MNLESIDDPAALAWAREWSDKTEARFPRPETQQKIRELPVSYTHLTLPTKLL